MYRILSRKSTHSRLAVEYKEEAIIVFFTIKIYLNNYLNDNDIDDVYEYLI